MASDTESDGVGDLERPANSRASPDTITENNEDSGESAYEPLRYLRKAIWVADGWERKQLVEAHNRIVSGRSEEMSDNE